MKTTTNTRRVSLRLNADLVATLDAYARAQSLTRTALFDILLGRFKPAMDQHLQKLGEQLPHASPFQPPHCNTGVRSDHHLGGHASV